MKRVLVASAALALSVVLAGCGGQAASSSSAASASAASAAASSVAASSTAASSTAASSTASSAASSTASAASTSASSSSTANWTSALTAAEAAAGAGISSFGVPGRTVIADVVFTNPTFAYTEHVAQATYEVSGSAKLIVRKAEGAHQASLTDREPSSFSQSWKNTYEGFEVTSYGDTQGAAVICLWNDGTKEYGVTIEGLGSSKVTMDATDIDDIVKAVKAAETSGATSQQASGSSASGSASGGAPGFNVADAVWKNGLGQFVRYYYATGADGKGYWAVVTKGADGGEYTTYFDAQGNAIQGGITEAGATKKSQSYDGADFSVEGLVQQNGLGQFKRYYWIQGENGQGYWGIVTIGADGAEHTTYTDERGNIMQGGVEVGSQPDADAAAASFNVENTVQQNGLGEYQNYYWVQGSDGSGYWAIVTKGADGAEYTTYTDQQGNVVQGGAPTTSN